MKIIEDTKKKSKKLASLCILIILIKQEGQSKFSPESIKPHVLKFGNFKLRTNQSTKLSQLPNRKTKTHQAKRR